MVTDFHIRFGVFLGLLCCSCAENNDLLEKLNRIEERLEDIEGLKQKIGQLEDEVSTLTKWKSETLRLTRMNRALVTSPTEVVFHANIHGNVPVTHNQVITFDSITLNLEQAYNGQTGVFTSPTVGYYVFFVHFLTLHHKTLETQIVKNGNVIQNIYAGEDSGLYGPGSNMVITRLNQGDKVWVKIHDTYHSVGASLDGPWCTFAGFLLYAEV